MQLVSMPDRPGTTHNPLDIRTLSAPVLAIVIFRSQVAQAQMMPGGRVIHYQVVLDPRMISPSGDFVRLGNTPGDEITGWQPIDDLEVVETLATPQVVQANSGKTILQLPDMPFLMNQSVDIVSAEKSAA